MIASGVRSSCEALATKCRWLAKRVVEPHEHPVERVGQLLELVGGALERDPLAEVLARDAARGGGDLAQRPERAPGEQPPGDDRHDRHRAEREHVLDQQPVQRVGAELRAVGRGDARLGRARANPNAWPGGRHRTGDLMPSLREHLAEVRARVEVVADEQVAERQQHGAR